VSRLLLSSARRRHLAELVEQASHDLLRALAGGVDHDHALRHLQR